ncbi:hypothetical protein B7486_53410 [cyanobacterium TDX16]|nr:hypothetical protein B7486_53410 [cyanobacterium TDX16]
MRRLSVLVFVALVVVAAACGGTDDDVSSGGSTSSSVDAAPSSTAEVTSTTAAETTTTLAASTSGIVLGADGLGVVSFGQDPESAIAAVDAAFGAAGRDTGWVDAGSSDYGFCPAPQVRAVTWDDLTLLFSDGDTAYGTAGEQQHLFTYLLDGPNPAATTEAGVGIGSSSADVRTAYGDAAASVAGDELVAPRFDIDLGGTEPLRATLDDGGNVVAVQGGAPCGE